MTDIKKTEDGESEGKRKKLQLNKETLQDLLPKQGERVKGGAGGTSKCYQDTGGGDPIS